jgi:hypothetical protein
LREKQAQVISNPEEEEPSDHGDNSILPENQPDNLVDLIDFSDLLREVKLKILSKMDKKQRLFQESLENEVYDASEKLSPFQIKNRYVEYISKFHIKDLIALARSIFKDSSEKSLEILDLYIKEVLYLSLEKSVFMNKNYLFLLNSFDKTERSHRIFKPLLKFITRVKYFNFYSRFLVYFFRAMPIVLTKDFKYFKANKNIIDIYNNLLKLIDLKLNSENPLAQASQLKKRTANINLTLTRAKVNNLIRNPEQDNNSESSNSETDSDNISESNNSSSSDLARDSSSSSNGSYISLDSNDLESSNKDVLKEIKLINKTKDKIGLEIRNCLILLFIALFSEQQDLNLFDSPINSFFACVSIRPRDQSFMDTLDLSQYYSYFIYSSQLLLLESCFSAMINNPDLNLTLFDLLESSMNDFFNNTTSGPLSEILNNRLYCFRVNKDTSTSTFISINHTKKETVSYKKITISVDNLRFIFKNLLNSTNKLLEDELLFGLHYAKYKEVTLESYSKYKDRSLTILYKCFKDLSPNTNNTNDFLKHVIFRDTALWSKFFADDGTPNLNFIYYYLKNIKQFKKYLFLLIYLTSGLPLRGTELATLRYLNSKKDTREIFFDIGSGLFIINISYYKGQGLSEKKASNIRYVCTGVSRILLLFIVLIDPFVNWLIIEFLSKKQIQKLRGLNPYFFFVDNKLLDTKDLTYSLISLSNRLLGQKINIQAYRQIIITIIKEFMLEDLDSSILLLGDISDSLNDIVASQMNHSTSVENMHYARSQFFFKNINSNLQFKYLQFCLRYFAFFKLNSHDLLLDSYTSALRIKDNSEKNTNLGVANSLAVKYFKVTLEDPIFTLQDSSSKSLISNPRKHTRQASSINSTTNLPLKKIKTSDLIKFSSIDSISDILINMFRYFFQDISVCFKSPEQELLIRSILLKIPFILAILPTSTGKSLSYLFTSALSLSKVTVVIILLKGLKSDVFRRAREFNIPCSIYENNQEFKNLTLVSMESITSDSFIFNIKNLIESNSLDRIILEECYLLISAVSYRSIMYRFKELMILPTQFVFISGTFPIKFEFLLNERLLLTDLSIIRATCLKSNISYHTLPFVGKKEEDKYSEMNNYINKFKVESFLTSRDKILIFCPSLAEVESVASYFNCSFFHSELGAKDQEVTLENFFNKFDSFNQILVATSGLQEGLDYHSVRLVIYKDFAYSFLGFLQGSARAGRDDLNCTSLFFYDSH